MEQTFSASVRKINPLLWIQKALSCLFKHLVLISSFLLCHHFICVHTMDTVLNEMQTVHFTAEELLTGQFSSWAEIQCSFPSPSGPPGH